ncbi:hypothetical protein ACLBOM_32645 [Escherichia coli]
MDERKIDFSLISSERDCATSVKTAREKAKRAMQAKKGGKRRQVGKKVNFEPDSAFRGEKLSRKRRRKTSKSEKAIGENASKIAAATKASVRRKSGRSDQYPL